MSEVLLSAAHQRLRAEVRAFAETEIAPRIAAMEASRCFDREASSLVAAHGWCGATIPRSLGGVGAGHLAKTLIIEELSQVSPAMGAMIQAAHLGTSMILHYGDSDQQKTWLPAIAAGEQIPTIAVTEAHSGSHVLGADATARRNGDHYILNGSKVHVGDSHIGTVHGVVARTGEGSRGLSAFLVEADRKGVSVEPQADVLGLHGFSFGQITLRDVRVPVTNRLGDEGDGRDVADSASVLCGRPNLTAVALGTHQRVLDVTVAYTRRCHRYDAPLHALDTVADAVGAMASRLRICRDLAYLAVHQLDEGYACDGALMNAKLINVESVRDSARQGMDILGAAGLYAKNDLERCLRDAECLVAPAGTSAIQRKRLAQMELGAYRGQWSLNLADRLAATRPSRRWLRAKSPAKATSNL